jgi:hypothetical protein
MAHRTTKGEAAPRTLFSLDRGADNPRGRKGRGGAKSAATFAPPEEHLDDPVDEPVEAKLTDPENEDLAEQVAAESPAHADPCPSCEAPLVAGAAFCGECGTRVATPDAEAAVAGPEDATDEPAADLGDEAETESEIEPEAEEEQSAAELADETDAIDEADEFSLEEESVATDLDGEALDLDELDAEATELDVTSEDLVEEGDEDRTGAVLVGAGAAAASVAGALVSAPDAGAETLTAPMYSSGGAGGTSGGSSGASAAGKKKAWIVGGGIAAVVVLIALMAFSGGDSKKATADVSAAGPESTTTSQVVSTATTLADASTTTVSTDTTLPGDTTTTVAGLPGSSTTLAPGVTPMTAGSTPVGPPPTTPPPTTAPTTTVPPSPAKITASPACPGQVKGSTTVTLTNSGQSAGAWAVSTDAAFGYLTVNGSKSTSGTLPGGASVTVTISVKANTLLWHTDNVNFAFPNSSYGCSVQYKS